MQSLYVSISELRREGLTELEMSNDRVLTLIDRMSKKIDLFTKQFFTAREEIVKVDGEGISYTSYPNEVPIIKVNSIKIIPDHSHVKKWSCIFPMQQISDQPLSPNNYTLTSSKRQIEMIEYMYQSYPYNDRFYNLGERYPKIFPEGSANIEINGVFGYVENQKEFETTVANDVLSVDTIMQVVDASGIEQYDQIIIDTIPPFERRVVAVDYDNNQLTIDQPMRSILTGTKIKTYGAVPLQIAECVMRLINRYRSQIFDPENGDSLKGAIFKEKIDMYQWEAKSTFINGLWNLEETNWASTGDLIVDRILQEYISPIYIGIV
ncbi:MAG: hypothetical protein KKD01_19570 [Proteobacteria bacterium]|nr:hypothetical protein [Pseudomonadota bacterium]